MTQVFPIRAGGRQGTLAARLRAAQRDRGLARALARAAQTIVADARAVLADASLPRAKSVHELRKAFKRWRALLRLVQPAVGPAADRMRRQARELMHELSGARDWQAALDALRDLEKSRAPLASRSLAAMRLRLTALRDEAGKAAWSRERRARVGAYLARASTWIEAWAGSQISSDAVADALTATYRRARKRVPNEWKSAPALELHALRRRVVEQRYQMELLQPLIARRRKLPIERAQRLRSRLGACQDLAVLRGLLQPRGPLARWRSQLIGAIETRLAVHRRAAARAAGELFAQKPKAFRTGLATFVSREAARQNGRPEAAVST